jgi:hypothetical protein
LRRKVGGVGGALGSEFLELWSLSDDADELVGEVEPPILALGELSGDRGIDDKLGYVCDMYAEKFSEGAPGVSGVLWLRSQEWSIVRSSWQRVHCAPSSSVRLVRSLSGDLSGGRREPGA